MVGREEKPRVGLGVGELGVGGYRGRGYWGVGSHGKRV